MNQTRQLVVSVKGRKPYATISRRNRAKPTSSVELQVEINNAPTLYIALCKSSSSALVVDCS